MWEDWIERIGPWAVFFGLMIEGETTLILAGYALHSGHLDLLPTLLLGAAGGTCSDSIYYWLGRRYGSRLLRSRRALRPLRARAVLLLRRYGPATAFLTRFAIGMRIVLPIAMGASRMRPRTFHPFNALGAVCFAVVYLSVGYGVGTTIRRFIRELGLDERYVVATLLALGAVLWALREWRLHQRRVSGEP